MTKTWRYKMFCKVCGRFLDDGNSVCSCGKSVIVTDETSNVPDVVYAPYKTTHKSEEDNYVDFFPSEDTVAVSSNGVELPKEKKKFSQKAKRILISGIIACAVLCVTTVLFVVATLPDSVQKFVTSLEEKDYASAEKIYTENISGNDDKVTALCESIKERLNNKKESFSQGTADYDIINNEITALEALEIAPINDFLNQYKSEIEQINQSHIAFVKAEGYYQKSDYPNAIKEYKNVIEADKNYDTAQTRLTTSINTYRQENFALADSHFDNGEYTEAVSVLERVLRVLEKDSETTQKLENYSSSYITKTLNKATALSSNGKYLEAIDLLRKANDTLPDSKLTDKIESCTGQYAASVINSARILADRGDYIGAIRLLNNANTGYPSSSLQTAISQYTEVMFQSATPLFKVSPLYQNNILNTSTVTIKDFCGGVYTGCTRFETTTNSSVEYELNSRYIGFNGFVTAANMTGLTSNMNIEIYVDDKLVFSQKNISRSTPPVPFYLNLLDAQSLKIVTSSNTSTPSDYLYLVDTFLY